MEEFAFHYPHLRLMLAFTLHLETMYVALWPVSPQNLKESSRGGIKTICFDPAVRRAHFTPCPQSLVEALYDIRVCAQNMLGSYGVISAADTYTRECILSNVLQWHPEEGVRDLEMSYTPDCKLYYFCKILMQKAMLTF